MLGQLASSLCCHVGFLGAFTLHTPGIRPLCAYKYSEVCELLAALKHQSSLYIQCLKVGLAGRITTVLGKEKGEERETPIIWEGPLGPDSFPEPVFEFPPQHKSEFPMKLLFDNTITVENRDKNADMVRIV